MSLKTLFQAIIIPSLSFIALTAAAQSSLVFRDAENTRIGELVQLRETNSTCNGLGGIAPLHSCDVIARAGVYLLGFNTQSGELDRVRFWFFSDDCSGEPRLNVEENGTRGGALVYTRRGESPLIGVVDWGAPVSSTHLRSNWEENGECADLFRSADSIPINLVDPSTFGAKILPNEVAPGIKGLGFVPPIIPVVEQPEHLFCDGFESCPTE
jgi:hypothetical protein